MKNIKLVIITVLSSFLFSLSLFGYTFTKETLLIERDKFLLSAGYLEYYKKYQGSVYILPFYLHLGLSKKVEFIGLFPYIQLRQELTGDIDTFGDILLLLKLEMKKFNFKLPVFNETYVFNQWDLIFRFNTATGPSKEQNKNFSPYSYGIGDFSAGFFFGQQINDFNLDINFIYTFAAQLQEEYLPFSDKIYESKNKTYFFDIHKVIVKFLWFGGRYPWADKKAPKWEQYPHMDDYFNFDSGICYNIDPSWSLFSYNPFIELNWLQSWSIWCPYRTRVMVTPGIEVLFTETMIATISSSIIIYKPEEEDFYFDNLYYMGIKFLL